MLLLCLSVSDAFIFFQGDASCLIGPGEYILRIRHCLIIWGLCSHFMWAISFITITNKTVACILAVCKIYTNCVALYTVVIKYCQHAKNKLSTKQKYK